MKQGRLQRWWFRTYGTRRGGEASCRFDIVEVGFGC
jgi:hypothetical protein